MKLIIDIDEDYYKAIWENGYIYDEDNEDIAKIIKDGTSLEEELEKIKAEIAQINKIYYPDLSFNETGDCYIQRKSVAEVIDNHISELKGENNG